MSFAILEDPNEPVEIGAFACAQIAIMFALGILALIMLLKQRKEISELWQRKWNITE